MVPATGRLGSAATASAVMVARGSSTRARRGAILRMDRILAGRYELEIPLGRGGSGEVWRGRDLATRRPVAVKIVELTQTDDPGMLSETIGRFRREAIVIGSLRHPNIVSSLEAGRVGNQLFMVMELAPGISLASMMDERGERGMGLFPVSGVLRIAEETCAGLSAAHEAGVVHRDIKPSNLMVTPQLGVKIIDFGIARLLADNSPRLTLQGHTVGTAAYMSPEQAQGGDIDGRADLYSLGCVLYHLLSGRLPFRSSMPGALLMMQVMDSATPLNVFRPDLPDEIIGLVSDLMEKDRAARPASAAEVISRVQAIGATLGSEEPAHEADRQTVMAKDPLTGIGETRHDAGEARHDAGEARHDAGEARHDAGEARRQAVAPETVRPGAVTPDRLAEFRGPQTAATPSWGTQGTAFQPAQPPYSPPPQVPVWQSPSAVMADSGGIPTWPVPPPRPQQGRPRRRWAGLLSTLVTLALAAGVWIYVYERTHNKLTITGVTVTVTPQVVGCNRTADIIGTITTNGHGGPISYQWVRGTEPPGAVLVADDASGKKTVSVQLKWAFHGKGTVQAVAKLRVLTPDAAEASITFPYSCS
jgi:eukaryotic-like serine/threonine-protein kinase